MLDVQENGRLTLVFIASASVLILGAALVAQYGFGLMPCELCYAQRPPYALTFMLALLAMMPAVDPEQRRIVVLLCAAIFAVDAGIAGYHAGVEWKWWQGPTACTGNGAKIDFDNLAAALQKPAFVACDQPAVRVLGVSMAGYNFIAATVLTIAAAWAGTRFPWWTKQRG